MTWLSNSNQRELVWGSLEKTTSPPLDENVGGGGSRGTEEGVHYLAQTFWALALRIPALYFILPHCLGI